MFCLKMKIMQNINISDVKENDYVIFKFKVNIDDKENENKENRKELRWLSPLQYLQAIADSIVL